MLFIVPFFLFSLFSLFFLFFLFFFLFFFFSFSLGGGGGDGPSPPNDASAANILKIVTRPVSVRSVSNSKILETTIISVPTHDLFLISNHWFSILVVGAPVSKTVEMGRSRRNWCGKDSDHVHFTLSVHILLCWCRLDSRSYHKIKWKSLLQ